MNYGGELPGVRNFFYHISLITSFSSHLHCARGGVLELWWQCRAHPQMDTGAHFIVLSSFLRLI
jgi:hypothetical protein